MNIYPLKPLCAEKSTKGKKALSRVLEIVCLDEDVCLTFKINSLDNLWEYEDNRIRNLIQEADERGGTGLPFQESFGGKLKGREDVKQLPPGEDYVVLDGISEKNIRKYSIAYQTMFTRLIRLYPDEAPQIISPNNEGKASEGSVIKKAFIFCNPEKETGQLKVDDFGPVPVVVDDLFLMVDMRKAEYREELMKHIPELKNLPDHVQHSLQWLPSKYKNYPEKLAYLTEAYEKYWGHIKPGESSRQSVKEIDKKTEKHIRSSFSRLQNFSQKETEKGVLGVQKLGRTNIELGDAPKEFSIKVIKPDFVKQEQDKKNKKISLGVPIKFWVLHCVAEFFWKDVNREDLADHPSGKHIEHVLRMINNPKVNSNKIWKLPLGEELDVTPFSDASGDLKRLLNRYPEISYLIDVNFASDYRSASSIIRPLWAKSKEKQTGYAKKADDDKKIFYSVTREKGDPPMEWE